MVDINRYQFEIIFQFPFHDEYECNRAIDLYLNEFELKDKEINLITSDVFGAYTNLNDIDKMIEKHLTNWKLNRLEREVVALIRLGVYKLMYTEEHDSLITNNIVELSKDFTEEKNVRFINGILRNISKEVRGINE